MWERGIGKYEQINEKQLTDQWSVKRHKCFLQVPKDSLSPFSVALHCRNNTWKGDFQTQTSDNLHK